MDVLQLFAHLLDYPTPDLGGQASACLEVAFPPQVAAHLEQFCAHVRDTPLDRLQEVYTVTFDLKPSCYPYVGYHLFGESYKRGTFMARLNAEYNARGFAIGNELPDHLPVVLRFLASHGDTEFSQTLLHEGVIPALEQMARTFDRRDDNAYAGLIRALLLVLKANATEGETHA